MIRRRRLFLKHFLGIAVPVLVPLTILGIVSIRFVQMRFYESLQQQATSALERSGSRIESSLNQLELLTVTLGSNLWLQQTLTMALDAYSITYEEMRAIAVLKRFLEVAVSARPELRAMHIYSANSRRRTLGDDSGLTYFESIFPDEWFSRLINNSPERPLWHLISTESDGTKPVVGALAIVHPIPYTHGFVVYSVSPGYVEMVLREAITFAGQRTYLLDESDRLVMSASSRGEQESLRAFWSAYDPNILPHSDSDLIVLSGPDTEGWRIVSAVPRRSFDSPLRFSRNITIALIATIMTLGALFALNFTRRNARSIREIMRLLVAAEHGEELPVHRTESQDEYAYIVKQIINNFVQTRFLKTQLSERHYRARYLELRALQSQVGPHFLFNTLESVNWEIRSLTGGQGPASNVIENLSDLLRYSLNSPDRFVPLGDEIENARNFVDILKYRYGDQVRFRWDLDPRCIDIPAARMVIQPLVENAVYHGVLEKGEPGTVIIASRLLDDGAALISVSDDGVGMTDDALAQVRRQVDSDTVADEHIGLVNTNRRLQLLYGDSWRITIASDQGKGTTVTLRLPSHAPARDLMR